MGGLLSDLLAALSSQNYQPVGGGYNEGAPRWIPVQSAVAMPGISALPQAAAMPTPAASQPVFRTMAAPSQGGGNLLATIFPRSIFARAATQNQQQQFANQTLRWLISQGVQGPEAAYLVSQPTALNAWLQRRNAAPKTITAYDSHGRQITDQWNPQTGKWEQLGGTKAAKKMLGTVSTDVWGNPVKEFYDPVSMQRFDLNGNPVTNGPAAVPAQPSVQVNVNGQTPATQAAGSALPTDANSRLSGEAFLRQNVPPALQDIVRKVAHYEADVRALGYRGETRSRILSWASQYNPKFDEAQYTSRLAAIKEFNSGGPNAPATQIVNGNVALQHAAQLLGYSTAIGGPASGSLMSGPENYVHSWTEWARQDPNYARYNALLPKFVEEMTRFYKGTGGNEADIKRDVDNLSIANSPQSRRAALQALAHAIHSKINSLQDRYRTAMGHTGWMQAINHLGPDFPIMQQHGQAAYDQIMNMGKSAAPQIQEGATATNPKTGQRIILRNGKWEPLQ